MAYLGLESIRVGNTAACVKDIFTIIYPDARTVLDTTYGKGRFWKWDHQLVVTGTDIDPQVEHIVRADYRQLPFSHGFVDVMCFDPIFIFSAGISRVMGTKRFFQWSDEATSQMIARPKNPVDLLEHTRRIFQQRSIASKGLIIKGQDLVVNASDYWMHNVLNLGVEEGAGMPYDILYQHSPASRMKDKRWKNQYHFRRVHAIYLCYRWDQGKGLHTAKAQVEMEV